MDNFTEDFQNQINTCVEDNQGYNSDNVKLTYNFSLLTNKWFEVQQCYTQILCFSNDVAAVEDLRCLMRSINQSLFKVRRCVIQGYTFSTLRDSEQIVIGLDKMKSSDVIFLKNNLQGLASYMQNAVNILCNNDSNIRGTRAATLVKDMCLLTQNCVESVESVIEQNRAYFANLNQSPVSSCADNAASRRVNTTAQLRHAYFSNLDQSPVSSCDDNAASRRVNTTAQLRRDYFADLHQSSVSPCADNAASRRVNTTAQLRRAYFADLHQSSVSPCVNNTISRR